MDHISIPESQVVPLESVASGIHGLRIAFVNVFGISQAGDGWTLIDAGIPFSATYIRRWAEKEFGHAPRAIVLTHGHFDHVSAASELADHWDVPIYAHPLEFPYLTGERAYDPPNPGSGGGLMAYLSPMYPRGPVDLGRRLRALPEAATTRTASPVPDWRILHTPGHTPGHISLFRESDRVLLPGDAFCTTKAESFFDAALSQIAELHGPPAYFTSDWNSARTSVATLAALEPAIVAPGHGKPLAGGAVAEALHKLAENFDALSRPENRKAASS